MRVNVSYQLNLLSSNRYAQVNSSFRFKSLDKSLFCTADLFNYYCIGSNSSHRHEGGNSFPFLQLCILITIEPDSTTIRGCSHKGWIL